MEKQKFEPGQELYFVGRYSNNNCRYLTIEKVGSKWLTVKFGARIDKTSLVAEGNAGKCWLSREDYDSEMAANRAARRLSEDVRQCNATLEQIMEARRILGLPVND